MPVPATSPTEEAKLIEVFSSIQGEGLWVGCRQIFLRFADCNLACRYCDTPHLPQRNCRIEDAPGSGQFRSLPNPVALEILHGILSQWHRSAPGMHHSLSLTGGEPLAQAEALQLWLPRLRELLPIYLETNGTLPEALKKVIADVDYVSMDVKLESVSGEKTPWSVHGDFLRVAAQREGFVKVVVGEQTPISEICQTAELVHDIAPQMPLVIQPLTEQGQCAVRGTVLLQLQQEVSSIHSPVRVIPQTHRFIDVV